MQTDYLEHYGRKGMKWYQHKYGEADSRAKYKSTGIRAAIARKQNEKVDESFKNWKANSDLKANAVDAGKKANQARLAYEANKTDKDLKKAYKDAEKDYKKALRQNTDYRQGQIRKEVGSDISRKYLSQAKKIEKQLKDDPENKNLQKQYNELMSKHDVERARARKAVEVGQARSARKAAIKRGITIGAKTAVAGAVTAAGVAATNKYILQNSDIKAEDFVRFANVGREALRYLW